MQILRTFNRWERWLYYKVARFICARQWHKCDIRFVRYPGDTTILGGFEMFCTRCHEVLGTSYDHVEIHSGVRYQ